MLLKIKYDGITSTYNPQSYDEVLECMKEFTQRYNSDLEFIDFELYGEFKVKSEIEYKKLDCLFG